MLSRVAKALGIILIALSLTSCSWFLRERVVYKCPVSAYTEMRKPPIPDLTSNEGLVDAYFDVSETLGQCNADKLEIKRVVEELSPEE